MWDELRKKIHEDFNKYLVEYNFWQKQITDKESREAFGVAAAQYYGMICSLINLERELMGEHDLADAFKVVPVVFC